MTTCDRDHPNLLSSDERNDPDQIKCILNSMTEEEIVTNGTCDSNSEPLCTPFSVNVVQCSHSSVKSDIPRDEQVLKSKSVEYASRFKHGEASCSIKDEIGSSHEDLENLDSSEHKAHEKNFSKFEIGKNEKIVNILTVHYENAKTNSIETLKKHDGRANVTEKNCKNGVKSVEKIKNDDNSSLISVDECNTDLDSLERRNCCDVFPQRDGDSISTKSECELEMSGSIDDLKVNFTINDGDGQMDLTHEQQCKIEKITAVLKKPILDVSVLQQFAEEDDGFVTDELRREVWPCLILMQESKPPLLLTLQQAQLHPSFSQVVMDVERTLKRFPPNISPERRRTLMDELIRVIMTVLQRNPLFHYYQGYHDVGITFLLVCGEQTAVQLLEELSLTHLREFLQPTMERTQRWLTYIYPMIAAESPALYAHMDQSGVGTMFCLPWLITWYAHSLSQYRHVVRLYDFLLASPPLMPMYVAGVILLQRKQQLLDVPCDMPMLHQALSSIPDSIPLDKIFREARLLYKRRPPSSLSEEVDRYLLRQKEREEAERAERDRRVAARKSGAAGARPWWLPYSVMRPGRIWVRAAGAVAVVAVVLGLASFYFRPENKLLLPVQWSTERPISAPQ